MIQRKLTKNQLSVLHVLNKEHLTSSQILKRIDSIPMILKLYSVLDELKAKGVVDNYMKGENKYHYTVY
jgi:Fe2+ or Zn2+ uptake regulation protein